MRIACSAQGGTGRHREVAVTWLAYLIALGTVTPKGILRPIATAQEDSHIYSI